MAKKPITVDRFSKISDRWLTPVDRAVDRPKPRVWVSQSVDRHGVQSTARSTGERAHKHTPMGQNCGRPRGRPI